MSYTPTPREWINAGAAALEYGYPEWADQASSFDHNHEACLHMEWPSAHNVAAAVIGALRELGVVDVQGHADAYQRGREDERAEWNPLCGRLIRERDAAERRVETLVEQRAMLLRDVAALRARLATATDLCGRAGALCVREVSS